MTSEELESIIQQFLVDLRTEEDDKVSDITTKILNLSQEAGINTVHSHLASIKNEEVLTVQWIIEDIMEELIPPTNEIEEEEEDDPTKRELRESELQMMAQVPQQGLVLFKSKVDTRWVLMQIDPYTGQLMGKQELDDQKGQDIFQKMNGAPRF
jgi:hypothetical protein